jgi:hypothetical protein
VRAPGYTAGIFSQVQTAQDNAAGPLADMFLICLNNGIAWFLPFMSLISNLYQLIVIRGVLLLLSRSFEPKRETLYPPLNGSSVRAERRKRQANQGGEKICERSLVSFLS